MPAKRFTHTSQFTSDAVKFSGASAAGDAVADETKNIDYAVPYDLCITGALVLVKGGNINDKVCLQIVHPQAGVLDEFVADWYMNEDRNDQFSIDLSYPANIPAGLIIRAVYKASSAAGTRDVRINYFLHKVIEQA